MDFTMSTRTDVNGGWPIKGYGVKHAILNLQLDALATLVDEQATRRLWKC